jgi:RNA polymerase-associated protein
MTLFSSSQDSESHRARMVLAEKDISVDVVEVDPEQRSTDPGAVTPYDSLPTLVDRDLSLYDSRVIMEYLDERFPHPPLMPVDPVSRAKTRLALHRIEHDWYGLIGELSGKSDRAMSRARKRLRDSLTAAVDLFAFKAFFLSDEFSLLDCYITPILWRLPHWGIELPSEATPIMDYAERMFCRPAFRTSLTEAEREMRP